jgi:uroporphyrinogen-III decarboxylase
MRSGKAVMGGIDETTAAHLAPSEIAKQITNSIHEVGARGLLITPGCSVSTDMPVQTLRAVKTAVEHLE